MTWQPSKTGTAVYSLFIRFLWGDEADWVLYVRTSDNSAAVRVTGEHQPGLQVMPSCAAAAGLPGETRFGGDLKAFFPAARGDACAHLRLTVLAGQQGNENTDLWLSESGQKGGRLPGGLVPDGRVG